MTKRVVLLCALMLLVPCMAVHAGDPADWAGLRNSLGAFLDEPSQERAFAVGGFLAVPGEMVVEEGDPAVADFEAFLGENLDRLEYQIILRSEHAVQIAFRLLAVIGLSPEIQGDLRFAAAKLIRIDPQFFLEQAAAFTLNPEIPLEVAATTLVERYGSEFAKYELKKRRQALMTVGKGKLKDVRTAAADAIKASYNAIDRGAKSG
jgi:hypothetical protein